jgi:hypothetical protein
VPLDGCVTEFHKRDPHSWVTTTQSLVSPQLESLSTITLPTTCPLLSTIPTSTTASVPTKPAYSLFSRPLLGTPGIATICGKKDIPPRTHDHLTNNFFPAFVSRRLLFHWEPIRCRRASVSYVRCEDILRLNLNILKAIIPVPGMDYICSPRGEALRPHRIASRDHNYYRGPRHRARSFRSAERLAGCDLRCNRQGTYHPSGELLLVP